MATIDELEQQKLAGGAGGSVLAGSGGAAQAVGQSNTGSGFTNLQKYLSANQGQGGQLADTMIKQGQVGVDQAQADADKQANDWADNTLKTVTSAGNDAVSQVQGGNLNATYGGIKDAKEATGYNEIEQAQNNASKYAQEYGGDYGMQKAGMQKEFGYGSGFGALDTFLGRQDGKDKIQNWQQGVKPGSTQGAVDKVNAGIAGANETVGQAVRNQIAVPEYTAPSSSAPPPTYSPQIGSEISDADRVGLGNLSDWITGTPTTPKQKPKPLATPASVKPGQYWSQK